jgi:hypothetical protein
VALVAVVLAAIWFLLLWWHWAKYLPEQRAIVGCKHTKGDLVPSVWDVRAARYTALVWHCDDCPLQITLKLLRLPNGTWWHVAEEAEDGK